MLHHIYIYINFSLSLSLFASGSPKLESFPRQAPTKPTLGRCSSEKRGRLPENGTEERLPPHGQNFVCTSASVIAASAKRLRLIKVMVVIKAILMLAVTVTITMVTRLVYNEGNNHTHHKNVKHNTTKPWFSGVWPSAGPSAHLTACSQVASRCRPPASQVLGFSGL